jgi:hypothetical protein
MAKTEVRAGQIKDADIQRVDIDVSTSGQALIRKVIAGTNITIGSTGVDAGTGDVTINASLTGAWLLASGGTLTGANTINQGANDLTFNLGAASHQILSPSSNTAFGISYDGIGEYAFVARSQNEAGTSGVIELTLDATNSFGNGIGAALISSIPNGINVSGTWTATANNSYMARFGGSITARTTASDVLNGYLFNPTVIGGASNTQNIYGVTISPDLQGGADNTDNGVALLVTPTFTGTFANKYGIAVLVNTSSFIRIQNTSNSGGAALELISANASTLSTAAQFIISRNSGTNGTAIISNTGSGDMVFHVGGGERLGIISTGQLRLTNYTASGSFTGTPVGYLQFDSSGNIITAAVPSGGGDVSKSGTPANTQIATWTNSTTITGSSNFLFGSGQLIHQGTTSAFHEIRSLSGTDYAYTLWANSGGNFYIGLDNSTGGGFGRGNYVANIYAPNVDIVMSSNGTERFRISGPNSLVSSVHPIQAHNFRDANSPNNVNLANNSYEGRGVVANYSDGDYSGVGYNIRTTGTTGSYIAPNTDTATRLEFYYGGIKLYGWAGGSAGRTMVQDATSLQLSVSSTGLGIGVVAGQKLTIGATGTLHFSETGIGSMLLKGSSGTARALFELHSADGTNKAYIQAFNNGVGLGSLTASDTTLSTGAANVILATNGVNRVIVDSTGRVGINTAPGALLDVSNTNTGTTTPQIRAISTSGSGQAGIGFIVNSTQVGLIRVDPSGNFVLNSLNRNFYFNNDLAPSGTLTFINTNTAFMYVTSGADVGMGITPTQKLDVAGNIRANNNLYITNSANGTGLIADDGAGSTIFSIQRQASNEIRFQAYGYHTFFGGSSSGTERMRLDSVGLGIGRTAGYRLDIHGRMRFGYNSGDGTAGAWYEGTLSTQFFQGLYDNSTFGLYNGAWRVLFDSNGRMTIGDGSVPTTNTGLHINLSSQGANSYIRLQNTGSKEIGIVFDRTGTGAVAWYNYLKGSTTNTYLFWYNATGGDVASIGVGGDLIMKSDVTAFGTPSDSILKEDVVEIDTAKDVLLSLRPVSFTWKENTNERQMTGMVRDHGFIAQDVQQVLPNLVRMNSNGLLSLRAQGIIPYLVKGFSEHENELNDLKLRVSKLEKELYNCITKLKSKYGDF